MILDSNNSKSLQIVVNIVVMFRIFFKKPIFSTFRPLYRHTCSWGKGKFFEFSFNSLFTFLLNFVFIFFEKGFVINYLNFPSKTWQFKFRLVAIEGASYLDNKNMKMSKIKWEILLEENLKHYNNNCDYLKWFSVVWIQIENFRSSVK